MGRHLVSFARNLSIRHKLTIGAMGASGTALLITGGVLVALQISAFRQDMAGDLRTISRVIAANATGSLAFRDERTARELLEGLAVQDGLRVACIYDTDGALFASFHHAAAACPSTPPRQD